MKKRIIDNLIKEVSEKRAEIIDSFLKMFIASRLDWFKEKPERLRRIKLIEEMHNSPIENKITITYRIEMMSGKKSANKKVGGENSNLK